jgi:2-polyprenyl-3-methyl-5-hydroxy-6-metoxy-1,4-benzoquinol methylase
MDRKYWENIAVNYNEEIFDVLRNDKAGVIANEIGKHKSTDKTAMDIGCAIGKWIPLLATGFKHVIAADISAANLEMAKENCKEYNNVDYVRMDMSAGNLTVTSCDFAICINAILTDSLKKRINFFHSLSLCLNKEGILIIVVPSLESALYTSIIRNRWKIDKEAVKMSSPRTAIKKLNNLKQGNVDIDGIPTKHYLEAELSLLLSLEGFSIESISKVEYGWRTEFTSPPKWLRSPLPWDWMCVVKKKN